MMKNNEFDQWIQSSLNELESSSKITKLKNYTEPNWDQMSQILNEDLLNAKFDSKIKTNLQDAAMHSYEANWEHFQHKLQLIRERRNHIITARVLELSLILLIFWTLNIFSEREFSHFATSIVSHSASKPLFIDFQENKDLESALQNQVIPEHDIPSHSISNSIAHNISESRFNKNISSNNSLLNNNFHLSSSITDVENFSEQSFARQIPSATTELSRSPSEKQSNSESIENKNAENEHSSFIIENKMDSSSLASSKEFKENPDGQSLDIATNNNLQEDKDTYAQNGVFKNKTESTRLNLKPIIHRNLWFGLGSGFGMVKILSSSFAPSYIRKYNIQTTAILQNLNIELEYPNWMIEMGVSMSKLEYRTTNYLKFEEFKEGELIDIIKKMEFKLIDLPLNLHYKIIQTTKWSLSTYAGMSISICRDANYKITSAVKEPVKQGIYLDQKTDTKFIEVKYNNGFRNDKSLSQNSFANAQIGMRFSYKVLDYFKLYSDAVIKKSAGNLGFGPLDERYQNFNLSFGLLYSFK